MFYVFSLEANDNVLIVSFYQLVSKYISEAVFDKRFERDVSVTAIMLIV